jgi:hypothetical protein
VGPQSVNDLISGNDDAVALANDAVVCHSPCGARPVIPTALRALLNALRYSSMARCPRRAGRTCAIIATATTPATWACGLPTAVPAQGAVEDDDAMLLPTRDNGAEVPVQMAEPAVTSTETPDTVDPVGGVNVFASGPIRHAVEADRSALFDFTSRAESSTPLLKTRGP